MAATGMPDPIIVVIYSEIALKGKNRGLFLRRLGESDYLDRVDLDSTRMGNSKGLKVVEFKITAELVRPAEDGDEAKKG